MKKTILAFLFLATSAFAQFTSTGSITVSGTTCATNNACIVLPLANNAGSASIVLSGTFTGTIQFEAAPDGVNFSSIPGEPLAGGAAVSSATAAGTWLFDVPALTVIRARASAFASGTATVTITYSTAASASLTGANSSDPIFVNLPTTDPCLNSGITKTSVAINITSAATSALVAVSGSTAVYVCGFSLTISQVVTTANTIQFGYSTVAACASGVTSLTGLYGSGGVTAAAPIPVSQSGLGTIFKTPASNGLCVTTAIGATASFQGVLTYVQQ